MDEINYKVHRIHRVHTKGTKQWNIWLFNPQYHHVNSHKVLEQTMAAFFIFTLLTEQWEPWGFLLGVTLIILRKCWWFYLHVTDNETERHKDWGGAQDQSPLTGLFSERWLTHLCKMALGLTLLPAHGCRNTDLILKEWDGESGNGKK